MLRPRPASSSADKTQSMTQELDHVSAVLATESLMDSALLAPLTTLSIRAIALLALSTQSPQLPVGANAPKDSLRLSPAFVLGSVEQTKFSTVLLSPVCA